MYTNEQKPNQPALTKKQAGFLSFLRECIREKGYPPTVRELMAGLGFSSPHIVQKYLNVLERKGYIKRQFNRPRTLEIVDDEGERSAFSAKGADVTSVPIVGRVRAGTPHPAIEDIEGHISVDRTICRNSKAFLLRVVGDSMSGAHIVEGDLVLVVPQPIANNGEIVVALVNNEATVKRFYRRGDAIHLKPEHPTMKPIIVRGEGADVSIVGRVTAVIRRLDMQAGAVTKTGRG